MKRASVSRSSSLGVVPLAISEWKPEIAPQAIVMKQKGKTLPAKTGPLPSMKRVSAGSSTGGCTASSPAASSAIVPIFTKAER